MSTQKQPPSDEFSIIHIYDITSGHATTLEHLLRFNPGRATPAYKEFRASFIFLFRKTVHNPQMWGVLGKPDDEKVPKNEHSGLYNDILTWKDYGLDGNGGSYLVSRKEAITGLKLFDKYSKLLMDQNLLG